MEINYIYKKKYKNGLYDYTDADGNIIDYDDGKYTREEQYYIDTTPEEREEERVKSAQRKELYKGFVKTQGKMFLVNEVASDNHPAFQAPLLKKEGTYSYIKQPLWGNYWSERELCIVAGDTGVGKTVLALHIAKALAGGCVVGVEDNVGRPRKVLYVDFELDREGFYLRYGNDDTLEHLYWAGYNQSGSMPGHVDNACEWMLDSIKAYIKEYGIEAVIIDQPDRLRLSPKQWQDFLFAIKRLMAEYGIAVMLIVNTKPRNYNRPMELAHIYNHRDMSFAADSIIGIGADYKNGALRFIKVFKNKNRPVWRNEGLEGFLVDLVEHGLSTLTMTGDEVNDGEGEAGLNSFPGYGQIPKQVRDDGTDRGFILQIFLTAAMDEEAYLKPSKTKIREQKMIAAESMRKDGMLIDNIAIELDVPEGTVKRWVAGVEPLPVDKTPPPSGHPLLEGDFSSYGQVPAVGFDFYAKPVELTDEEWAVCVNNPESENYDALAYNPYLVESEARG